MRIPRTTGLVSGMLIALLAIWAGLIPFVGPYFHYSFATNQTWHYTSSRLWLDILPAALAFAAGLMLILSDRRTTGIVSATLGIVAGAWLVVGPNVSAFWGAKGIGHPLGSSHRQALEQLGYFYAAGALIVALSAFALGRFLSRPRLVEEPAVAAAGTAAAIRGPRRRRFLRRRRAADERTAAPRERDAVQS
jgi:hypothetical protein